MERAHPLIAVVGPTASGKTDLSLFLAEQLGGEVVNYDSVQVYRYFDMGTAKVPPRERRGIPHHMLDLLEPHEELTAGEYARRARFVLEEIRARGRVPVLAGGTGFYLRALLEGLFPGPQRDEELRERLSQRPPGHLHRLLRRLDPASAERIHANDTPKLIRAIEVCLRARRRMSEMFEETRGNGRLEGFHAVKIGLDPPREELYARINRRAELMFENGLLEEVRSILARGASAAAKPFQSHGYTEALAVVQGHMSVPDAVASTQLRTRRYAKRQMTWFRRENDVVWLRGFGNDPAIHQRAILECGDLSPF